jgi:hypothetical protein
MLSRAPGVVMVAALGLLGAMLVVSPVAASTGTAPEGVTPQKTFGWSSVAAGG